MDQRIFQNSCLLCEFILCLYRNAMCGKIQCVFDSNNPPGGATVSVVKIEGGTISCMNADFDLGPDVQDPAYVKTRSVCAPGKVRMERI